MSYFFLNVRPRILFLNKTILPSWDVLTYSTGPRLPPVSPPAVVLKRCRKMSTEHLLVHPRIQSSVTSRGLACLGWLQ
ncbi:hypothetical protein HYQ44_018675 [Verticillium longisporum]|nr:hypothetical protein HYQ44_018675 [Verticillium longisporum]